MLAAAARPPEATAASSPCAIWLLGRALRPATRVMVKEIDRKDERPDLMTRADRDRINEFSRLLARRAELEARRKVGQTPVASLCARYRVADVELVAALTALLSILCVVILSRKEPRKNLAVARGCRRRAVAAGR